MQLRSCCRRVSSIARCMFKATTRQCTTMSSMALVCTCLGMLFIGCRVLMLPGQYRMVYMSWSAAGRFRLL